MIADGHFVCLSEHELLEIHLQILDETTWVWLDLQTGDIRLTLVKEKDEFILKSPYLTPQTQLLQWNHLYPMTFSTSQCFLFAIQEKTEDRIFHAYRLPEEGEVIIGRKQGDLCFDQPLLSSRHACFYRQAQGWWIKDLHSTNGVYVNRKRIEQQMLKIGDCIYFMGLQVLFGNGWISVNHASEIRISARLPPFAGKDASKLYQHHNVKIAMQKQPYEPFPEVQFECKDPPASQHREQLPLIYQLGPAITMSVASLSSSMLMVSAMLSNNQSLTQALPSLIMAGSMLLGSVFWPLLSRHYEKHREAKQEQKRIAFYHRYIGKQLAHLNQYLHDYRSWLWNFYYQQGRLWQQALPQDVLILCLGIADQDVSHPFLQQENELAMQEDDLYLRKQEFLKQRCLIKEAPFLHWVNQVQVYHIQGEEQDLLAYANYVLYHHITLYEPKQISCMLAYRFDQMFAFPHFLPHFFDDEHHRFLCCDRSTLSSVWMYVRKAHKPTLLLSFSHEYTNFVLQNLSSFPLAILAFHPMEEADFTMTIKQGTGMLQPSSQAFTWQTPKNFQSMVDAISQVWQVQEQQQFPEQLNFLEMLKLKKVSGEAIWQHWQQHDSEYSLKAALGVSLDGSLIELDLHERAHGPHGIVAGMTGSGKSELLITMILSLAISYHPYDCAFLLIDYKGGGMAKTLEELPHTAGIITNLDGSTIQRSLCSLDAELVRRQSMFADTMKEMNASSMNIDVYQSYYHDGLVKEPIPHLVIVADEFAELKQQEPQFMEQLIRIARIGRSLGIHLILATQKPSGVVDDQIWSNARFHICLKVADKSDSMDMLKKEDGAKIKAVGRFYLQVGYDEMFLQGQSAYAKGSYEPNKDHVAPPYICELGMDGRILQKWQRSIKGKAQMSELQVVLATMKHLAKQHHLQSLSVWQKELPKELNDTSKEQIHIALVDDPAHQRQFPISFQDCNHNTLLYAKELPHVSEAMLTIAKSATYQAPDTHVILLDGDQGEWVKYQQEPNVYAALSLDQEEDLEFLMNELTERKKAIQEEPWLILIHNVSAFLEQFEQMEKWLLNLAKDHGRKQMIFMMSATCIRDIPMRLSQQFETLFVFHLHDELEVRSLVPGDLRLMNYPLRALWVHRNQSFEVQFYHKASFNQFTFFLENQLPSLPEHVMLSHMMPPSSSSAHFPLGIVLETRKQIFVKPVGTLLITGRDVSAYADDLALLLKQLHIQGEIQTTIQATPTSSFCIICQPIEQLLPLMHSSQYRECEFQGTLYWLGKGLEDYRYLWNLPSQLHIKHPQDLLWIQEGIRIRRIEIKPSKSS